MKSLFGKLAFAASAAGLAAALFGGAAQAATPNLRNCAKAIRLREENFRDQVQNRLGLCLHKYLLGIQLGQSGAALADEAAYCNSQLNLAIPFPHAGPPPSQAQLMYNFMSVLVSGGTCTNDMIQQLGHVREDGGEGDTWVRLALMRNIQSAFDQQLKANRNMNAMFQDLYNSDSGVSCPLCGNYLKKTPCSTHACALGGSTSACVDTATLDINLVLTGVNSIAVCNDPLFGDDYGLLGYSSRGLGPVDLGGGTFACVGVVAAEGHMAKCSGGDRPKVSTAICQDHMVGSPETNECVGGSCAPSTPSVDYPGNTNGGACITLTTAAAASGDAFIANSTQINVIFSGQEGTDTIPCTDDDTGTPAAVGTVPLTTATATANLLDADTVDGGTLPNGPTCPNPATVTGVPFDCSTVEASQLTLGKFVGSFPGLEALFGPPRVDSITTFTLECN